jgi:hypothetical protein
MAPEAVGELLPSDSIRCSMGGKLGIPPSSCCTLKPSCSIYDLLSVITLSGSEHLAYSLQLVIRLQWICSMCKHRRTMAHELPVLVHGVPVAVAAEVDC